MWFDSRASRFAASASPTVARLMGIADGPAGASQTIAAMRTLVQQAVREPAQRIRELALSIIPSSAWVPQVRSIQVWVQQNIRYVQDPPDMELVQTPQKTVEYGAGDCDDQSVLVAALLTSVGHPSQFMAMGFNGGPLAHVVARTKIGAQWVAVETIKPFPLGYLPPGISSTYIRDI